jgi:hypothetical protein
MWYNIDVDPIHYLSVGFIFDIAAIKGRSANDIIPTECVELGQPDRPFIILIFLIKGSHRVLLTLS